MALLLPTVAVNSVTDITPELICAMNASAIILDVDNTLAVHGSQVPLEGSIDWVKRMRSENIKIIIVSNNLKRRVAPFAAKYDLPFLHLACKPFPPAYFRAVHKMGVRRRDVVVVGDQIFTDVIGANLSFMKSILLVPMAEEGSISFRIRRSVEKPLRYLIKKTGRGAKYFK